MNGKIVVVGSLHYDIVVESPHRPKKGETVLGYKWFPKFGGKGGNQAVAVAKAGCTVTMVSAVGNDHFASFLLHGLSRYPINTDFIQRLDGIGTGMSVAVMDSEGDYGAVVVSGANLAIDASRFEDESLWSDARMLILQNEVDESVNIAAATQAAQRNIPVCINAAPAKPFPPQLAALIDILVVNAVEAEALCNIQVSGLTSALTAAKKLAERYKTVIVTVGGDGLAYCNATENGVIPAIKVKLISTHGAGDCFIGHLCVALITGKTLGSAAAYANAKAAEHVSTVNA